jgi:eukaryotic-like serine/threonine-protein kinase
MGSTTLALAGRYRLEERIAAGGAGEVWRGHDRVLARAVAVKLLRPEYAEQPEALARFRSEARHAASLSHPGIAQVYDYGEDRQPFLVMELVEGPSLAVVLASGPLDTWHAMDVVAQTATALAAAHAAGLVHRDIKPGNLLLAPGGHVKVTDFGIAYAAGSAPVTRTGRLIGTPAYLAPERAAGKPATTASDLYSLGIVGYECLTGAPPFTGTSVEMALAHQRGQVPALPPQVPVEAAALVASLTAKDETARPASAADVARCAAGLRDAESPDSAPADAGWAAPAGGAPGPFPATLVGAPSQVMADAPARSPAAYWPPRRTVVRVRALALALGAAAIVAVVAGWLLSGGSGAARPSRQSDPAPVSASSVTPRSVEVRAAALIGQPVSAVCYQLRQLGLRVEVVWQVSGHQQPGTVISVQPARRVTTGTTVTVTGALAPPGHRGGHGHDNGNQGNGNDGSQGD